jgi:hypothetical protein
LRVCGRITAKDEQEKETQLELSDPSGDFGDSLKVVVYQSAQVKAFLQLKIYLFLDSRRLQH